MRSLPIALALALAACGPAPAPVSPGAPPPASSATTAPAAPQLTPEQLEQAACSAGEDSLAPPPVTLGKELEISGRAVSVEVTGEKRLEPAKLQGVLATKPGAELSSDLLRADAQRIFELGGVEDVRVELVPGLSGPHVRFVVVEDPELAHVYLHAPKDPAAPADALPKAGSAYDGSAMARALTAVTAELGKAGYLKATASARGRRLDDGRVDLCVTVEPGAKILVRNVELKGAKTISAAELSALRETRGGTVNVAGTVLDRDLLDLDTLRMNAHYFDRGMIQARVSHATSIDDKGVDVVFEVQEGPVFRLAAISVAGDLAAPKPAYLRLVHSKPGEVMSRARMLEDIERLNALHHEQKRDDLEVLPETVVDQKKRLVTVTLRVHRVAEPPKQQ